MKKKGLHVSRPVPNPELGIRITLIKRRTGAAVRSGAFHYPTSLVKIAHLMRRLALRRGNRVRLPHFPKVKVWDEKGRLLILLVS